MMKNDVPIGKNRTGIALSPIDKREMLEVTDLTRTSAEDDASGIAQTRIEYIQQSGVVGSVPPPASVKGVAATGTAAIKGVNVAVFVDKLGERLGFERTGVRLYDALVTKCHASDALADGPTAEDLEVIRAEELAHFDLLRDMIESLGADPTALTPSADLASVASTGILHVIDDPRTSLKQSLEAILIAQSAELAAIDRERDASLARLLAQRIENETDRERQEQARLEERIVDFQNASEKLGQFLKPDTSPVRIPTPNH